MKRIEILSIRSTSNLKSILKSSRLTWVLQSDRLENVRAVSFKHVKRIEDIGTRDYFLKTHKNKYTNISPSDLILQSAQVFDRIDHSILSIQTSALLTWYDNPLKFSIRSITQSDSCKQGLSWSPRYVLPSLDYFPCCTIIYLLARLQAQTICKPLSD